jgi:hypothetical protein
MQMPDGDMHWSDVGQYALAVWVIACAWMTGCWLVGVEPRPWKWWE